MTITVSSVRNRKKNLVIKISKFEKRREKRKNKTQHSSTTCRYDTLLLFFLIAILLNFNRNICFRFSIEPLLFYIDYSLRYTVRVIFIKPKTKIKRELNINELFSFLLSSLTNTEHFYSYTIWEIEPIETYRFIFR